MEIIDEDVDLEVDRDMDRDRNGDRDGYANIMYMWMWCGVFYRLSIKIEKDTSIEQSKGDRIE